MIQAFLSFIKRTKIQVQGLLSFPNLFKLEN